MHIREEHEKGEGGSKKIFRREYAEKEEGIKKYPEKLKDKGRKK